MIAVGVVATTSALMFVRPANSRATKNLMSRFATTLFPARALKQSPRGQNNTFSILAPQRENIHVIESILHYWFGQAAPDVNQKNLWMIQDKKRLEQKDEEIFTRFGSILAELSQDSSNRRMEWCRDTELYGYRGKMAAIIVLDQFSRHIHRYDRTVKDGQTSPETPNSPPHLDILIR